MKRGVGVLVAVATMAALGNGKGAADAPIAQMGKVPAVQAGGDLSILSYNVEGLPWPIASGRTEAAAAIADRLAGLRMTGAQPHIVAVQEAFGEAAKDIGRRAGYRFTAFGPSQLEAGATATDARDRAFVRQASLWIGETLGKYADSGLAIFSDYPILSVKRIAFPDFACAGLDCLANKGVLAVTLQVPGAAKPVVVIDTHLNSRSASYASDDRSFYAYSRQIDALDRVIADARTQGDVVLAGDFNVGRAASRPGYLGQALIAQQGMALAVVEQDCGHGCRRFVGGENAGPSLKGAKSLLAFAGGLKPTGTAVSFGKLADGRMLSDHIGIERRFRIGA